MCRDRSDRAHIQVLLYLMDVIIHSFQSAPLDLLNQTANNLIHD